MSEENTIHTDLFRNICIKALYKKKSEMIRKALGCIFSLAKLFYGWLLNSFERDLHA